LATQLGLTGRSIRLLIGFAFPAPSVSEERILGMSVSLAASIGVQWRVIVALMIREGQADYSRKSLGFFWVIGEPLLLTCGVIALWMLTRSEAGHGHLSIIALAITAYTHVQLWRRTVLLSLNSIHLSGWAFYHRNINILDLLVAHCLKESIAIFTSFVILYGACLLFKVLDPVRDPGLIVAAWCLDTLFCTSFSILMAGIAGLSEIVERLTHPLMYITLPITGAFTMTDWLPPRFKIFVEWIPLANCCEMLRAGVFPLSVKTYWSVPLIVLSSLFLLVIGLPVVEYARKKLEAAV
jgi:capsular polysaccharide transport system permease protein